MAALIGYNGIHGFNSDPNFNTIFDWTDTTTDKTKVSRICVQNNSGDGSKMYVRIFPLYTPTGGLVGQGEQDFILDGQTRQYVYMKSPHAGDGLIQRVDVQSNTGNGSITWWTVQR